MTLPPRLVSRALITAAASTTLYLGSWAGIAPAWAHVHVNADDAVRGSTSIVTFQVPNESEKVSATTEVTILLPDVASASTDLMPGWTAKLGRDTAAGTYRSVTWTAAPNAGIPAEQFELFQMSVTLPDAEAVSFPTTQTYADGTVVRWDQPPLPDGSEPEYPAPVLTLTEGPVGPPEHHAPPTGATQPPAPTSVAAMAEPAAPSSSPDNTARALAGGALLLGALGVGVALIRRRT